MELRQMSAAFLFNGNEFLMIKKTKSRLFDFEYWSSIGGHLEPEEINKPRSACLREILEETGIEECEISDLKLRYILLRKNKDEIRQHFVYFGTTSKRDIVNSDEGELYWVGLDEIKDRKIPTTMKFMLKHYSENSNNNEVVVGTITLNNEEEALATFGLLGLENLHARETATSQLQVVQQGNASPGEVGQTAFAFHLISPGQMCRADGGKKTKCQRMKY